MTDRREPVKNTCPDINLIISTIQGIIRDMEDVEETSVMDYLSSWKDDLKAIAIGHRCDLEDLRTANSALREWGNALVSDIIDVEEERDVLAEECERLKEELSNTEDEILRTKERLI